MNYKKVIQEAQDLIMYGTINTEMQRSLSIYVERGELSDPRESLECAYRAGYEIDDITQEEAELIYDAIGEYGDAVRDNSIKELINIGKNIRKEKE